MTEQEIFDRVESHLLNQMKASKISEGDFIGCAYRGEGGLKCAVGILIPDEVYDPEMEDLLVGELCRDFPKVAQIFDTRKKVQLALVLQQIHDCTDPSTWESKLKVLRKQVHGRV